jgi:hypothetical protein
MQIQAETQSFLQAIEILIPARRHVVDLPAQLPVPSVLALASIEISP